MLTPTRIIGASKLATVSECQSAEGVHIALKHYDRQTLSAFQSERVFAAAQRWKELESRYLVRYLEVLPKEQKIAMELLDRSAAVRLAEGHSDPRLVLHMLRDMLSALAFIHEKGRLHVNLKPTNVFFGADGRARLSDGLMVPAEAPGTLPPPISQKYLTPEHTSDSFGVMSPATDLYMAGFLALELLAGDRFGRAFQGVGDEASDDDLAWFQWHGSSQEAPSATSFAKACPPELTTALARLVAKNPADRYATARQALQELPLDISIEFRTPEQVAGAVREKRVALASHVMQRPSTGIVLAVASGPRAGEMIGTNETEFAIGFDHDCLVRFSNEQYPDISAKLMVRRGPDGWAVVRVRGESAFVNQRLLTGKLALRSGDIMRLSSRGPDIQFTMQSGGIAVRSLVDRFLPEQTRPGPAPPGRQTTAAPQSRPVSPVAGGVSTSQPQPATSAAPSAPSSRVPVATPGNGDVPSSATAVAKPLPPTRPSPPARPGQPPQAGVGQPAAATGAAQVAERKAGQRTTVAPSWLKPSSWTKDQMNLAIAIVGGLLVLILVFAWPSSSPNRPSNPNQPNGVEINSTQPGSDATAVTSESVVADEPEQGAEPTDVTNEDPAASNSVNDAPALDSNPLGDNAQLGSEL